MVGVTAAPMIMAFMLVMPLLMGLGMIVFCMLPLFFMMRVCIGVVRMGMICAFGLGGLVVH